MTDCIDVHSSSGDTANWILRLRSLGRQLRVAGGGAETFNGCSGCNDRSERHGTRQLRTHQTISATVALVVDGEGA